ncbi:uncharacterized protein L201_007431 [Kwoniella dendrophila CBS 6074]|uniref:Uncharacterized protein n=1 Tax=Kwoniella dendrophila CBS 6074 TaxID=1295534 RepID=A0AAX4K6S8_9TREE
MSDTASLLRSLSSSISSNPLTFRPPPPVTPTTLRSVNPNPYPQGTTSNPPPSQLFPYSSQARYSVPAQSPPPSSQYQPSNDPFSRSYVPASSVPTPYGTPPSQSRSSTRPVDQYRPPSRTNTNSTVAGSSGTIALRAGTPASTPRTAQEIYEKGKEKKPTGVDKILSTINDFAEKSFKQNNALEDNIRGFIAKFDNLQNDITSFKDEITTLKHDNRQLRDKIHELQLGQRSLATRDEIAEEVANQLTTNSLLDNFQNIFDRINKIPENTSSLCIAKLIPHIKTSPGSTFNSGSTTATQDALTTLLNHVVTKFNSVDTVIASLQSLQGLPQAITDVVVFKGALDALTVKVHEMSQAQSQSQPSIQHVINSQCNNNSTTPETPSPPTSSAQAFEQLIIMNDKLDIIIKACELNTNLSGELKTLIRDVKIPTATNTSPYEPISHVDTSEHSHINNGITEPLEATQRDSLDSLASVAASQAKLLENQKDNNQQPKQPGQFSRLATPDPPTGSNLDMFDSLYTTYSFERSSPKPDRNTKRSTGQGTVSEFPARTGVNTSGTLNGQGSSLLPDPGRISGRETSPIPNDIHKDSESSLNSKSSTSPKRAKFSPIPDPSDRPVTRSMSNQLREPIKWNPISHAPRKSYNKKSSSSSSVGQSKEHAIEISSGSSNSQPSKRRGRPPKTQSSTQLQKDEMRSQEKIANPLSRSDSDFRYRLSTKRDDKNDDSNDNEEQLPNSGIDSLPSNDSFPNQPKPQSRPQPLQAYSSINTMENNDDNNSNGYINPQMQARRNRAKALEEERNRRKLSTLPTLGSSIGIPMSRFTSGKRRLDDEW